MNTPDAFRVLVTGSRYWTDTHLIYTALDQAFTDRPTRLMIVVHGCCKTGADAIAAAWAQTARADGQPVYEERHPAQWSRGRTAGPQRNQRMVDRGAHLCLAFPLPTSTGTEDTIRRARNAGIPVEVIKP
ncbi:MAG: DUF2493 domain-containing protein [Streptomycetaceae bacterium]|nr:DUF2493 domain-containing protein [Streptomycetaceae bacterium]